MDAIKRANREHNRALKARDDKSLGPNQREYKFNSHMLHWATLMAQADTANAIRWSTQAAEWSKRLSVALDAIYHDELDEIRKRLDERDDNAARLKALHR